MGGGGGGIQMFLNEGSDGLRYSDVPFRWWPDIQIAWYLNDSDAILIPSE